MDDVSNSDESILTCLKDRSQHLKHCVVYQSLNYSYRGDSTFVIREALPRQIWNLFNTHTHTHLVLIILAATFLTDFVKGTKTSIATKRTRKGASLCKLSPIYLEIYLYKIFLCQFYVKRSSQICGNIF